jgi:hypothetical protein
VALQGKLGFFPVTSTIFVRFTQNFSTSIRYYLVMVVFSGIGSSICYVVGLAICCMNV